jgi:uncharacterized protein YndB with AHSA1/START domain
MLDSSAGSGGVTTFSLSGDREIVLERVFDAPRELVFRVVNDPALLPRWWGPSGLTTAVVTWDARPGGAWRVLQRDAGGNEYGFHGVYQEIVPPERVVRTFEFEGTPGHVVQETVTFEDLGGRTRLRMTSRFASAEDRDAMLRSGAESGARESMDRLAALLGSLPEPAPRTTADREIVLTRVFDAPRALVFRAWTDPAALAQWWGGYGFTITTHAIDVRPGGVWRFVIHGPDGTNYDAQLVYLEVAEPERLVCRMVSGDEHMPGQFEMTVTFAEEHGRTTLTWRALFRSAEERQQAIDHDAIEGGRQTLERLDAYLSGREVGR